MTQIRPLYTLAVSTHLYFYPIFDTRILVLLRPWRSGYPHMDSETVWTVELWLRLPSSCGKTNVLAFFKQTKKLRFKKMCFFFKFSIFFLIYEFLYLKISFFYFILVKVTKVTTKSYLGYYLTPKLTLNKLKQHTNLVFVCLSQRPKPSAWARWKPA